MRPTPVFFTVICFVVSALHAAPPFLTGDPGIAETSRLEFIPGWSTERRAGERLSELPAFELNYGVSATVEVSYGAAWLRARTAGDPHRSGYGNSIVAAKWRLLDGEKDGVTLAVSSAVEFRNPGSRSVVKGLVPDENTFGFDVRAEKEFAGLVFGAAAGWSAPSKSDGSWNYGLIARKDVAKKFSVGLELIGEAAARLDRSRFMLNAGVRIVTGNDSALLLGLGREVHCHDEPRLTRRTYVGWQQVF